MAYLKKKSMLYKNQEKLPLVSDLLKYKCGIIVLNTERLSSYIGHKRSMVTARALRGRKAAAHKAVS